MVTDVAAVMARVANASVSREIHAPDETWMRCIAHFLYDSMKTVMSQCKVIVTLSVVAEDFRAMKIMEDASRSGWNHLLPSGYNLKQECETRFGTYYQVTERFLKSAPETGLYVENLHGSAVQEAFISLEKMSNIHGTIIGYPGIEAIFDGFVIVVH